MVQVNYASPIFPHASGCFHLIYFSGEPVGGELEAASADASDTLASDFSFE